LAPLRWMQLAQETAGRSDMSFFIAYPPWAGIVGIVFLVLFRVSRRRASAVAAAAWLLYGAYEMGMRLRWLCSGECNIRVDLLLIYPVLLVISAFALVGFARWLALREREPGA
jgi:phosphatidylserine synthase